MSSLAWFRFNASGKEIFRYSASVLAAIIVAFSIGYAADDDGDGYDDETGEWAGAGGGGDADGDGLSDYKEEFLFFNDPYSVDTDGDENGKASCRGRE